MFGPSWPPKRPTKDEVSPIIKILFPAKRVLAGDVSRKGVCADVLSLGHTLMETFSRFAGLRGTPILFATAIWSLV